MYYFNHNLYPPCASLCDVRWKLWWTGSTGFFDAHALGFRWALNMLFWTCCENLKGLTPGNWQSHMHRCSGSDLKSKYRDQFAPWAFLPSDASDISSTSGTLLRLPLRTAEQAATAALSAVSSSCIASKLWMIIAGINIIAIIIIMLFKVLRVTFQPERITWVMLV